jgi:hypothetical protein
MQNDRSSNDGGLAFQQRLRVCKYAGRDPLDVRCDITKVTRLVRTRERVAGEMAENTAQRRTPARKVGRLVDSYSVARMGNEASNVVRDLNPVVDLPKRNGSQQTIVSSAVHRAVCHVAVRAVCSVSFYRKFSFGKREVGPAQPSAAAEVIALASLTRIAGAAPPGAAIAVVVTGA